MIRGIKVDLVVLEEEAIWVLDSVWNRLDGRKMPHVGAE